MTETMTEPLVWINEPMPAKDGWYWAFKKGIHVPLLVQVFSEGKQRRISRFEMQKVNSLLTDRHYQWWYGPVASPPRNPE